MQDLLESEPLEADIPRDITDAAPIWARHNKADILKARAIKVNA